MDRPSFLTGEFRHALDDRGRVAVPVRFRPRLAQGATLARWLDGCLAIFPADTWEELAAKIQGLPTTNAAARQFGRFMSSGAVEVELDRQGRVLVPSYLREYAGLTGSEVVVVGALNRLEIWAPTRWQPYRSQIEDAAGGTRRAPRRPGHLTVPRPFMRLPGRSARRPTHEVHATWEKGTCRYWSTRFLPRWPSVPAAPWLIARSAAVGTPSGSWRPRLRMVACSASMPIGRPSRRRQRVLARFGERVVLRHANFESIYDAAIDAGLAPLDAVLFDLGLSSYQLADPDRGFSFAADAPPDMRFDETTGLSALELIDRSSERELAGILATFGEERRAGRIAKAIVAARAEGSARDRRGSRGGRGRRRARRAGRRRRRPHPPGHPHLPGAPRSP